jgi:LuxR family maltose regulon positive regulatory protein
VAAQLDAAMDCPLTVVTAPAGYGKTTAVTQFAEQTRWRDVWITLEAADDQRRGWQKIEQALRSRGVDPGRTTTELTWLSSSVDDEQALLLHLVEDVANLVVPTLIIIDNLDLIGDEAAFRQLGFLVNRLPPALRLLVISRAHLPIPIGRWRAQGLVAEVGHEDLRFSPEESARLFANAGLYDVTREEVDRLHDEARGWPLGVALLAASYGGRAEDERFDAAVAAEVVTDLLGRLDPDVQDLVLGSSILDRLTDDLCRAVTGHEDAGRQLQAVEDCNLFLVPVDDGNEWFAFEPLFAELMRWELARRHPERVPELHRRAAQWFDERGMTREAVRHLVAAGDPEDALVRVAADAYRPWHLGEHAIDWAALFPEPWIAAEPSRMLRMAVVLGQNGLLADARAWLERAEAVLAAGPADPVDRALLTAAKALWHGVHLDAVSTIELAGPALEGLAADPSHDMLRRLLLLAVANCRLLLDDADGAERDVDALEAISPVATMHDVIIPALRARIAYRRGELRQAEALASMALATAERSSLVAERAVRDALLATGGVLAERGRVDEATALVERSVAGAARQGWPVMAAANELSLAIAHSLRSPTAALATLDAARARVEGHTVGPELLALFDIVEARVQLALGNHERVEELVDRLPPGTSRTRVLVGLALDRGDVAEAEARLADAAPATIRDRIEVHLLSARVADAAGRSADCDQELLTAVRLTAAEDFRLVWVTEVAHLLPRLRPLVEDDSALLLHATAIEALAAETGHGAPPAVALSKREAMVLHYLGTDLSMQEIANQLDISPNTLKTHTKAIYRKLGITGRAAAVRIARQRGAHH